MTQEQINLCFQTELGQQCCELFSTPDDNVLLRYSDAVDYCISNNLPVDEILSWLPSEDLTIKIK